MQRENAFLYKIAVTANSSLDTLRLLCWAKEKPVIAISMGPFGQLSRILEKHITYASLDEESKTAPGQLTINELENYSGHNLYGLIGDPVTKSISHITHNHVMRTYDLDSLYIKMQVQKEELKQFLFLAKKARFRGLSVTMPLKEAVLSHLDEVDTEAAKIGAVNTLVFEEGRIHGYNTDGKGALNAIEKTLSVNGKHLVLLGAGGAARAIAYEAKKRGAFVTILNRDAQKARDIAAYMQCQGFGLDHLDVLCKEGYDAIINATPLEMPCTPEQILVGSCVMDSNTIPKTSLFLQHAQAKGCKIIYGLQMFVEQATLQFSLWFPQQFTHKEEQEALFMMSKLCYYKIQ
jgi:3-dehydroquinate dehydratase/shikimate dehydrogenase